VTQEQQGTKTNITAQPTREIAPNENDAQLEALREILLSRYSQRVAELEAELDELERRITDKDAFIALITPALGDAIRRKIRDARDEMIEILYPIIGQTVVRAVSEAIRDLARTLDAQVRTSFDFQTLFRRMRAKAGGVSDAEMTLRDALPFAVSEIFLIHRETGLLLRHVSPTSTVSLDSDLISGMLTAIRDFVQESFGQGQQGDLDEIQYGEQSIFIEAAQYAYLAVVVQGIAPAGFRASMRERLIEINHAYEGVLHKYEGDSSPLAPVEEPLNSLAAMEEPNQLSPGQKKVLAIMAGTMAVCLVATCAVGIWAWQSWQTFPAFQPVAVVPTPTATFTVTPTPSPSATPTPTPTLTLTPTAEPTFTPTATASPTPTASATPLSSVGGLMTGNVWLREAPSDDAPRFGIVMERGQPIEVLGVLGSWYQIRWSPHDGSEIIGWVPAQWVGTRVPIPEHLIKPTLAP